MAKTRILKIELNFLGVLVLAIGGIGKVEKIGGVLMVALYIKKVLKDLQG